MKNFNAKSLLMTPKQFYAFKALRQQSQACSQNETLFKKTIELFFQSTPIVDFDPAEQFQKIQQIPISQEKFCTLLTEVVFKKTKDKIDWAKNFLIIKSKKPAPINEAQEKQQQQPKLQPLKINRQKFLVDILINIKMSCSRLEQLLYKMIDIHDWRCQERNTCNQSYMEGYLAKLLFKKIIIPSGIFEPEAQYFKEHPFDFGRSEREKNEIDDEDEDISQIKGPKQSNFTKLKNQIIRWGGLELLCQLIFMKEAFKSLDQKPSSENKFFMCKQCLKRIGFIYQSEAPKKKNKKKNKNKSNPININNNLNVSQDKTSQDTSRKNSSVQIQDQTTAEDIDQELQYQTDKYYEKVSNFLEDLRIDLDNRLEIRLKRTQESDDETDQPNKKENRLMVKVKRILYKSQPTLM